MSPTLHLCPKSTNSAPLTRPLPHLNIEYLRDSLICTSASHVGSAFGEEVIDDEPEDWEEEDNHTPEQLVWNGAVGLQYFHCRPHQLMVTTLEKGEPTEDNDI